MKQYPKINIVTENNEESRKLTVNDSDIINMYKVGILEKRDDLYKVNDLNYYLQARGLGKLEGKAIWLHPSFNWQIVEDYDGSIILVALKK
jgi:hypothetical protein